MLRNNQKFLTKKKMYVFFCKNQIRNINLKDQKMYE